MSPPLNSYSPLGRLPWKKQMDSQTAIHLQDIWILTIWTCGAF
ncbi:hypothetical protein HMPREF0262_02193 [Clostridium sp. ATCC 29733]|nr:hypothetical protein HMPREF0262_02193 [Clostridium sp. ATCC 29733]